jgi:tetratricopeptide (TPR) repeat protein
MRLAHKEEQYLGYYNGALHKLGQLAHFEGHFAEAASHLSECLARPDTLAYSAQTCITDRLAIVYTDLGDLAHAAHLAALAVVAAEQAGDLPEIASALLADVEVALAQAQLDEAERRLSSVEHIAKETGNRNVRMRCLLGKARAARLMGRSLDAQSFFEQAYQLATSMGRLKDVAWAQAGVGFALLDQGKHEEAKAWLLAALEAAWQRKIMPEVIWAVVGLAALQAYAGQPQVAARWLQTSVAHPACPKRVQVEVEEIRQRLAIPEIAAAPADGFPEEADRALETVVLQLLG